MLQCGGPPNSASALSGHLVVMSDRSTRSSDRQGGNPDAAAAAAPQKPSRRPPAQRGEPPPPRPRAAGWGGAEKRKLATLFAEQGEAWQQIAIDLGTREQGGELAKATAGVLAKKRKEAAEERVSAAKKRRGEGASGAG